MPEKIWITGASGFIGGHVTRCLAEQGFQITCLTRPGSDLSFLEGMPVKVVHGDISDPGGFSNSMEGMDAVIHTAGKASDWGSYDEFFQVNVEGTLNVLRAATHHHIRQVIITGSVSSYGEENYSGLKDENSPFNSHYPYALDRLFPSAMNHYRDTKALMTREAMAFAKEHRMDLTIIEPVWVYGEHEFHTGFYEYLKTVKSGMPFMPGSKKNHFHVIYAGDLARAYLLALTRRPEGVVRIIAGNENPENMSLIFSEFCKAAGLKSPRHIPHSVIYPVAFLIELFATLFRRKSPPLLTRGRVNMFYDNIGYRSLNASDLLGFRAEIPLSEGIRRTVAWYQENHYL